MDDTIISKVVEQLRTMPDNLQQEVLYFTQRLKVSKPVGIAGKTLIQFAGMIPLDDLETMRQTIAADCVKVQMKMDRVFI